MQSHRTLVFLCCAALGTWLFGAQLHAQDAAHTKAAPDTASSAAAESQNETPADDTEKSVDEKIATLETHRSELHRGGPIAGVILSCVGIATGATFTGIGIATSLGNSATFDSNAASNATAAIGAIVTVGSIVGLVFAAKQLKHHNQIADALDREIEALKASSATRVSLVRGAPQSPVLLRF